MATTFQIAELGKDLAADSIEFAKTIKDDKDDICNVNGCPAREEATKFKV